MSNSHSYTQEQTTDGLWNGVVALLQMVGAHGGTSLGTV